MTDNILINEAIRKINTSEDMLSEYFDIQKAQSIIKRSKEILEDNKELIPSLKAKSNVYFMNIMLFLVFIYKAMKEEQDKQKSIEICEYLAYSHIDKMFKPDEVREMYKDQDRIRENRRRIIIDVNTADEEFGWIYENENYNDEILYGCDVVRCGAVTLFNRLGVPELVKVACNCDFYMMKYFPEGTILERELTLADGDDRCDFYISYKK